MVPDNNLWVRRAAEVATATGNLKSAQAHVEQEPRAVGADALWRCGAV